MCDREMNRRHDGDIEAFSTTETNVTLFPSFGRKPLLFILLLLFKDLLGLGYSSEFFKVI